MQTPHQVHAKLIPCWIWHRERSERKQTVLSTNWVLENECSDLELSLACTGHADVEIDGIKLGTVTEHPQHVTKFAKLKVPFTLKPGLHTVQIAIRCSAPMPISPVSIHLIDRTVGCIAFLEGEGVWVATNESWEADGERADIVCRLGEEPYGDLDDGPEWFVAGGFGDIATVPVSGFAVLSAEGTAHTVVGSKLQLQGTGVAEFHLETQRNDRHQFYHLLKQQEWRLLRTAQQKLDLTKVPCVLVDLKQELNARIRLSNLGHQPVTVLYNGAESMHELLHYDSCITECVQVPGNSRTVTLPQGMRYVKLYIGAAEDKPFELEVEFDSVGVPMEQVGAVSSNIPLLDRIYDVSVHTNRVCHQIGLWDGIKRDRLNWAYDFYMAAKADFVLWNDFTVLKRATAELGKTPYGYWMNSIPAYTLWWIIGLWEYYLHTEDRDFLVAIKNDLHKHLNWVEDNVDKQTGLLRESHPAFIEWVPMNEKESTVCLNAILKMMKESVQLLSSYIPELEIKADWPDPALSESDFLQGSSALITPLLGILSGYISEPEARRFLEDYQLVDPITPLSAYWLADCCSRCGLHEKAWNVVSGVWGAMLQEDATTFWESVVLAPGSDYHDAQTTYTAYKSYRMSLCHSWASTPVHWISKYVLGVQPLEPGYKQIQFSPVPVPGLTECRGTVSTPRGPLYIEWSTEGGVMSKKMHFGEDGLKCGAFEGGEGLGSE